jgi:hypothetical protein
MFARIAVIDRRLKRMFWWLGTVVGRHYRLFLILPVILSVIASTGLLQEIMQLIFFLSTSGCYLFPLPVFRLSLIPVQFFKKIFSFSDFTVFSTYDFTVFSTYDFTVSSTPVSSP